MSLTSPLVMTEALSLWDDLKKKMPMKEGITFTVHKGRFECFKSRSILHNIKMVGEAASSDKPTADAHPWQWWTEL